MRHNPVHTESNGQTRLAYILGVPLAENAVRQWPQMEELVRGRELIGAVEGNFEAVTLEVGRELRLENIIASSARHSRPQSTYWKVCWRTSGQLEDLQNLLRLGDAEKNIFSSEGCFDARVQAK
jgi:hypothetical protein